MHACDCFDALQRRKTRHSGTMCHVMLARFDVLLHTCEIKEAWTLCGMLENKEDLYVVRRTCLYKFLVGR